MENERHLFVAEQQKSSARSAALGIEIDVWLARMAGKQHGLVARRQLMAAGATPSQVRGRVDRGQLHQVHAGVYAVGHRLLTRHGRWMAAVLACGEGAALGGRSAARLWGIMRPGDEHPEVIRGNFCTRPRINVRRSVLPDDERTVVEGIPVTTVPRTMLDLAAVLKPRELERAWNEVEVRGLWDRLSVATVLERHPNRRGAAALRRLIDGKRPVGITRNDLEEGFLALVDRFGLPRPRMNAHLALRGKFYEVDCLWEEHRVAVELDGRAVHGTDAAFESDRERDRILIAEGFRTPRVTYRQMRDSPAEVAADLGRILGTPYP